MPSSHDPATLAIDERTREIAHILAQGLRRLRSPASHTFTSATQNLAKNALNELADAADKSVTVHAG